jgi:hypothetical protein
MIACQVQSGAHACFECYTFESECAARASATDATVTTVTTVTTDTTDTTDATDDTDAFTSPGHYVRLYWLGMRVPRCCAGLRGSSVM